MIVFVLEPQADGPLADLGEYFFDVLRTPRPQDSESPANPKRFSSAA